MQPLTRTLRLIHRRAVPNQTLNSTTLGQYPEARTTVAAQTEATTMGKRIGKRSHCPRKHAAPTTMGTTYAVSILGVLTRGGNTTPITCGGYACRHQQHRSYHQHERAHTSSHRSHHQRDRGPTQRLKHSPYDMLNLSASSQDILTKLGFPSCLLQLK